MGAFDGLRADQISHGYWGNHTSTIDWCEANYHHTPYIAEFVNTLTNVPTILAGLYGCIATLNSGLPKRYALTYLGLSLIGVGSFGFHASLRWEWQLMDELPMIYVVTYAAYLTLDTLPGFKPRFGIWGPLVMLAWDVFVTVSYIYLPNPVYHQIAFACILLTSTIRTILLIYNLPEDNPHKMMIAKTMVIGIATFAAGFAIWNIDNIFCPELKRIREYLGPLGVFVEGHAYWHLMTGYGSYLIFTASTLLVMTVKTSFDGYTYDPEAWLPVVETKTNKNTFEAQSK